MVPGARLRRAWGSEVTAVGIETGIEPAVGIGGSLTVGVEAGVGVSIGVELSDAGAMGCV